MNSPGLRLVDQKQKKFCNGGEIRKTLRDSHLILWFISYACYTRYVDDATSFIFHAVSEFWRVSSE